MSQQTPTQPKPTALLQAIDERTRFLDDLATTGQYDHPAWKTANHVARYDAGAGQCKLVDPEAKALPDQADDDDMAIPFVVSTLARDRDGDVLVPGGCKDWLPAYANNPVWLFAHSPSLLPIGLSRDKAGNCTIRVEDDRVLSVCHFHKETPLARDCYRLTKAGILSAASVGFIPHKALRLKRAGRGENAPEADDGVIDFDWPGFKFTKWELCEISLCVIQSNREAIRLSLDKGIDGRPLGDQARRLLAPYTPGKTPQAVSGWDGGLKVVVSRDEFPTEDRAVAHVVSRGLDASDYAESDSGWVFRQADSAGHFCRPAGAGDKLHAITNGTVANGTNPNDQTNAGAQMSNPNGTPEPAKRSKQVPKLALAALGALYGLDPKELAAQAAALAAATPAADDKPVPPGAAILVGVKEIAEAAVAMTEQADVVGFLEATLAAANKCAGKAYPKLAEGLGFKEVAEDDDPEDDDPEGDDPEGDDDEDETASVAGDTDDLDDDLTEDEAKEFEELRSRISSIIGVAV